MTTNDIWEQYYPEMYFFILKRTKNNDTTNEIIQNAFVKIHCNLDNLKDITKIKAWIFRIVRNEIINFNNQYTKRKAFPAAEVLFTSPNQYENLCCFDKFINELPPKYKTVINLIYVKGYKLTEAANFLNISLANTKARIRRAKDMLKNNFMHCCKFSLNKNGKLSGEANCSACHSVR